MMNVFALSLLVTSLAAASLFSPPPKTHPQNLPESESTIVKEGHRVVVVEYDQDGLQNTKISISSPQVNDAYGKCKHKIVGAVGKANDVKASETTREVGDKAKEAARDDVGESAEAEASRNVTREEAKEAVKKIGRYIVASISMGMGIPSLGSIMSVLNLLGLATAYGLCVWVTFISTYVLSRVIPRQQFGVVQSKVYPVYFRAMTYTIGLALLGHVFSPRNTDFLPQSYNLLASLIATLINSIYLEPRATKVMFERMKVEKEEGRGRDDITVTEPVVTRGTEGREHHTTPDQNKESSTREEDLGMRSRILRLNQKLSTLNSYSSCFNILTLMSLTWHLLYLAQLLHCCS
ncbi:Transmembrane protein 205 [Senna tora]|uniref:Transmembrane protein 205 n=1 Tax=Senna tora TaxID=362788 RepID=A0A834TPA4_9FABA|nr:Transmembrane protein 205 [Senna tora]